MAFVVDLAFCQLGERHDDNAKYGTPTDWQSRCIFSTEPCGWQSSRK